jgi:hypothetical protein
MSTTDISTACYHGDCKRCPGWVAWKNHPDCLCPHHFATEEIIP